MTPGRERVADGNRNQIHKSNGETELLKTIRINQTGEWRTVAGSGRRNADDALAVAVASGQTLRDAAAAVGVAERTAARRWADPAFRRRVSELRGDMTTRAAGRLVEGMVAAADKLRQLVNAADERVALAAAKELLAAAVRIREAAELEQRLADLEERIGGRGESA